MRRYRFYILFLIFLIPTHSFAASFEASLQSLVGALVSKIMPLISLPFVAANFIGYIRGDSEAVRRTPMVVFGVMCLLGINGVWSFLQSHIH